MGEKRWAVFVSGFLKKIPQDYLDDMLVRLAHHSAGIDGFSRRRNRWDKRK
jgi:hypothetical protein